jgi:hypothetical protein
MLDFFLACARKEPHYRIYFWPSLGITLGRRFFDPTVMPCWLSYPRAICKYTHFSGSVKSPVIIIFAALWFSVQKPIRKNIKFNLALFVFFFSLKVGARKHRKESLCLLAFPLGAASLWVLVYQRVRVWTFPHISLISSTHLNPADTFKPRRAPTRRFCVWDF